MPLSLNLGQQLFELRNFFRLDVGDVVFLLWIHLQVVEFNRLVVVPRVSVLVFPCFVGTWITPVSP